MREVILICGPPGGGKTTAAHMLAASRQLAVYDRDDPKWTSERAFSAALRSLGRDPNARAVVIRTAAASSTRRNAAVLVGATEVYLALCSPEEARRRVVERGRADVRATLAGINAWFEAFDHMDGIPVWSGQVNGTDERAGRTSREW